MGEGNKRAKGLEMRQSDIIPYDRATPKQVWKALDSMMRLQGRVSAPYLEKAYTDMLIYGQAHIDHGAIQRDVEAELARIQARKKR